jgi:two-component system, sensor histidine kinase
MDSKDVKNSFIGQGTDTLDKKYQDTTFSHEIKSHLNSINGFLELIKSTSLSCEQSEYLYHVGAAFHNLIDTIEKKFSLTKIKSLQTYPIQPVPFSIQLEAKSLIKSLEPLSSRCDTKLNLVFDPRIPNLVVGIPMQLKVLLTDILFQFIHFTKPSSVEIEFNVFKQTPTSLEIMVHISSPQPLLDQNLQQKISKSILNDPMVKLYSIENSCYKQWSKEDFWDEECQMNLQEQFVIAFSFEYDKQIQEHSFNFNYKDCNILIVEDDPINQKLLFKIIQKLEIQTDLCENGEEAVEICKTKKYDIIFMDYHMPIMDGLEATQRIREENNPNQSSLIIGITAYDLEELERRSTYSSFDGTIEKPIRSAEIKEIIHNYNLQKNLPSLHRKPSEFLSQ